MPDELREAVTIAEMARTCNLSRARFYELMSQGIFPTPLRNETGRPYYSREQQAQCLAVRRTNCGVNGRPVMFYARGLGRTPGPAGSLSGESRHVTRKPAVPRKSDRPAATDGRSDAILATLRAGLAQLGVPAVPDAKLSSTLAVCFPDGHAGIDAADVLTAVYRQIASESNG